MSITIDSAAQHFRNLLPKEPPPGHKSVNELHDESLSFGQRIADGVARNMGSWRFILIQSSILTLWILFNAAELIFKPWDPYPFILLNLMLSFQAAYAAPFIMMSQNRQADKDRLAAEHDYCVNIRAEARVRAVLNHLQSQDDLMLAILRQLEDIHGIAPNPQQRLAEEHLAETRRTEESWLENTVRLEEEKLGLRQD